ncbi:Retrovirus-related Pol polyprotein from transposon [Nosema granulosis]|uniref:Retrovirus-related Pol polyprotein from transposon n=1 Tax=Nosema granulosis TaxID=83296 RepID=A0A9P6H1H2_9MICR|nr:Retrovirus-related Pol polyprotein from transposon [Nosema granulosis]
MCIDYRPLNNVTVKDRYPLPRIDEIMDAVAGARIFSTLDATSGYYQLEVDEADKNKTAFSWRGGHYEFNRMPFGLCNAPSTFQRAMDSILREEREKFTIPYLDDIIIYSQDMDTHKKHVRIVMEKLRNAGITLNKKKCKFFQKEIKILGNIITEGRIKPDPEKVKCIKNYPRPNTVKELRSFIGLLNYCREFIKDFASKAKPLFDMLKGETKRSIRKLNHTNDTKNAFEILRAEMTENTSRKQPDFSLEFILITDASEHGIGAILAQKGIDGKEEMISAYSKNFDKHQANYSVTDKELLAVVKGIEHFRHYLLGKEFILRTDHKALTYLWTAKNPTTRLLRWALKLQEYKFKVQYIKGEDNASDGLSRICRIRTEEKKIRFTEEQKRKILDEYHIILGHGSANNMKAAIRARYKWDNMFKEIDEFTKNCLICKKSGFQIPNTKNKVIETKAPNELWEIDLVGRIVDRKENLFIMVCVDHHTKWLETKILKNKSAEEIVKAVEELITKKKATPKRILTDCGLEFVNERVRALADKYKISWEYASPFHHQTTGAVERVIQTFMGKLKKLSEFGRKNWKKMVEPATLAVNLSFNRAIGTSPFVFTMNRLPELEIDRELGQPRISITKKECENKRKVVLRRYREAIIKGKKRNTRTYKIGDKVLIFRETQNKMKPNWHEGYKITEVLSEDSYLVKKNGREIRVNKNHIKGE